MTKKKKIYTISTLFQRYADYTNDTIVIHNNFGAF